MDLQLPERQTAELASLSSRTGRSATDLGVEAVDRLLAEENWFHAQVQEGIDQIARGEFVEEKEMDARGEDDPLGGVYHFDKQAFANGSGRLGYSLQVNRAVFRIE